MSKRQVNKRNYNTLEPQPPIKYNAMMRTLEELKAMFNVLDNARLEENGIKCYNDEIWVEVFGVYPEVPESKNCFQSNYGRLMKFGKKTSNGKVEYHLVKSRIKDSKQKKREYPMFVFQWRNKKNKKTVERRVNTIGALIFLRNEYGFYNNSKIQSHHIDVDTSNNRADNLCMTYKKHHDMIHDMLRSKEKIVLNGQERTILDAKLECGYSWTMLFEIYKNRNKYKSKNVTLLRNKLTDKCFLDVLIDTDEQNIKGCYTPYWYDYYKEQEPNHEDIVTIEKDKPYNLVLSIPSALACNMMHDKIVVRDRPDTDNKNK